MSGSRRWGCPEGADRDAGESQSPRREDGGVRTATGELRWPSPGWRNEGRPPQGGVVQNPGWGCGGEAAPGGRGGGEPREGYSGARRVAPPGKDGGVSWSGREAGLREEPQERLVRIRVRRLGRPGGGPRGPGGWWARGSASVPAQGTQPPRWNGGIEGTHSGEPGQAARTGAGGDPKPRELGSVGKTRRGSTSPARPGDLKAVGAPHPSVHLWALRLDRPGAEPRARRHLVASRISELR